MNSKPKKFSLFDPPKITVDPTLDEKYAGKVLFPEKLAQAKELLAKHPLPDDWMERKA